MKYIKINVFVWFTCSFITWGLISAWDAWRSRVQSRKREERDTKRLEEEKRKHSEEKHREDDKHREDEKYREDEKHREAEQQREYQQHLEEKAKQLYEAVQKCLESSDSTKVEDCMKKLGYELGYIYKPEGCCDDEP